ncbi:hypothetical protein ACHAWO_008033 [Cyclotella atomus]|uniref:Uncharacterized protein n=1 Tax=Cyclotella atomus TaxID=382360 RepID=A0ABD3P7X3_9STRA
MQIHHGKNYETTSQTINELTCTNFQISNLRSSYTLPPPTSPALTPKNPTLHLTLSGISASCTGKYNAELLSGNVLAQVGGDATLDIEVASAPLSGQINTTYKHPSYTPPTNKGELPFPTLTILAKCITNFEVKELQFTGSISSKIIGLFSELIQDKLTEGLNGDVCRVIKKEAEGGLEKGLSVVGRYIAGLVYDPQNVEMGKGDWMGESVSRRLELDEQIVAASSSTRERDEISNFETRPINKVQWERDMPFLKRVLVTTNQFISRHMNEGLILQLLQKLSTWPASLTSAACTDCGFFFKGINGLIKSLTKGSGVVNIPIPETILNFHRNHTFAIPNYGNLTIVARQLQIGGLDNLTSLQLFQPRGDNMLSSALSSEDGLNITFLVDLTVVPSNEGEFHAGSLNESFLVSLNSSAFNFTVEMAVDLDAEIYNRLSVGSFMFGSYTIFDSNRNALHCILEVLTSVVFTSLRGSINLDVLQVMPVQSVNRVIVKDGNLEDDLDEMINNVMQMLLLQYPETVTESLGALIQTPARLFLNDAFSEYIGDSKKYPLHCANVDIPDKKVAMPLELDKNGAIVLFNEVIDKDSTIDAINSFMECLVDVISSNNLFAGHFFNMSIGEYTFVVHDVQFENVNRMYELGMLHPEMDAFHLSNHVGYGQAGKSGDNPAICFGMNIFQHGQVIGNIVVHANMVDFKLNAGTELKFDMNWLPQLKINDLLSHPQCISIPVQEMSFYGFNARMDVLHIEIGVVLSDGVSPGTSTSYSTDNSTELAYLMSNLMTEGAKLLETKMIHTANSFIKSGASTCKTPVNPQRTHASERSTAHAGLWTFLIVLAFMVGNAWLFMRGFKPQEPEGAANMAPAEARPRDSHADEEEKNSMTEPLLNDDGLDEVLELESPPRKFPLASSSSLMFHPSIQPAVKFGFPCTLVLALILFVASNISIGASVDLIITGSSGQQVTSANIYAFSLASTLQEMYQAGVYFLMLLILFCSGVWPYVKLLALMFCWMSSTRRLPPVKRERILYLLDSLGKFSLIDAYVLVLMMVAFRYGLEIGNLGAINVYITPTFGFYSFLFATIMSLVSGHVMLYLHRKTLMPKIPVYSGRHESLSRHIFEDKHGRGLVKLTRRFRRTIVVAMLLTFILICVGVNLKCFHFTFTGVGGIALGESRVRQFSLVSIGEHIPLSVQDPSKFGIHWIQTTYYFFAVAMPLVCLFCLFVLFVYPMTIKQQQKVFVVAEVTNAWSAIEVFVIAIVASLIEISPFSDSMVGQHCITLNQILSGWTGESGEELHQCFGVKSSLDASSAVLIIGVMLNSLLISTLHRFAHHAMWERIEREDRPDATEDETKTVRECASAHTFVSKLRQTQRIGTFMFDNVSFGPHSEYEVNFEDVLENEEPDAENFWTEWRKVVSVI